MTLPVHDEQAMAWTLRGAWGRHEQVRLTLSQRCMVPTIVGHVTRVSVTGALILIDGWDVPTTEILGVGKPTREDHERYRRSMERVRREFDQAAEAARAA